jgi:hypothetical protein
MQTTCLKLLVAILLAVAVSAPSCWANEKGYCYILSYSMRDKVAFLSPVFTAIVSGAVYSDEEYVADVELIRDIEGQFQDYQNRIGLNSMDYITEARVAFRSSTIADQRRADEKRSFESRGYTVKRTGSFTYTD